LGVRSATPQCWGWLTRLSPSADLRSGFEIPQTLTITRKLGEFKELGYIELVGSRVIIIKDLEALESYVL
jgi:hypothetical protein